MAKLIRHPKKRKLNKNTPVPSKRVKGKSSKKRVVNDMVNEHTGIFHTGTNQATTNQAATNAASAFQSNDNMLVDLPMQQAVIPPINAQHTVAAEPQNQGIPMATVVDLAPALGNAKVANAIALEPKANGVSQKYPGINAEYQYGAEDIELIVRSALQHKLIGDKRDLIVDETTNTSLTVGYDLTLADTICDPDAALRIKIESDALDAACAALLKDGVKHAASHIFLIPLNIKDAHHWALCCIKLKFVQVGSAWRFDKSMEIEFYDSMPTHGKLIRQYALMLEFLIKSIFAKHAVDPNLDIRFTYCEGIQQPDVFSCGVIVVDKLLRLAYNQAILTNAGHSKYTLDEIMEVRKLQIELIENVDKEKGTYFRNKQFNNKDVCLKERQQSDQDLVFKLANDLYTHLKSNAAVIATIKLFCQTEEQLCDFSMHDETEMAKLEQRAKKVTAAIKYWFTVSYGALGNLPSNFFKPKVGEQELEWCEGGKDNLLEVLRKVIIIDFQNRLQSAEVPSSPKSQSSRSPRSQSVTRLLNPESPVKPEPLSQSTSNASPRVDFRDTSADVKHVELSCSRPMSSYTYSGTIANKAYRWVATGMGHEIFMLRGTNSHYEYKYEYMGEFLDNARNPNGFGRHAVFCRELGRTFHFYGDALGGGFWKGDISCILGPRLENNLYVTFQGSIREGRPDLGVISYIAKNQAVNQNAAAKECLFLRADKEGYKLLDGDGRLAGNASTLIRHLTEHREDFRLGFEEINLDMNYVQMQRLLTDCIREHIRRGKDYASVANKMEVVEPKPAVQFSNTTTAKPTSRQASPRVERFDPDTGDPSFGFPHYGHY